MSAALYCERSGRGEPLVLLHGWGMNLRVFDPLRARLAAHYAVTRDRSAGTRPQSLDRRAARGRQALLAGVAASVPRGATLLGWSLGAQLALELARDTRLAISRLVLIATTPRFVSGEDWPHGAAAHDAAAASPPELARDPSATVDEFLTLQVRGSAASGAALAALRHAAQRAWGRPARSARGRPRVARAHRSARARARAAAARAGAQRSTRSHHAAAAGRALSHCCRRAAGSSAARRSCALSVPPRAGERERARVSRARARRRARRGIGGSPAPECERRERLSARPARARARFRSRGLGLRRGSGDSTPSAR